MDRLTWALYRAARRLVSRGLTREDHAEMDELVRSRLRAAAGGRSAAAAVWCREFSDLLATSVRQLGGSGARNTGGGDMGTWMRDLAIAVRGLRRRPGFSAAVAVTLGLGIGATTTIYSVVDGVVLRPLAYEHASRLVAVGALAPGERWVDPRTGLHDLTMISLPNYLDFSARVRTLERVAALESNLTILPDGGDGPEVVAYARASPGLLEMLGAQPALGRLFVPEEYGPGASEVVVLSHGHWLRRFGGDPGAVGRPATPGGDMMVVGVLPPDFRPPEAFFPEGAYPELWLPIQDDAASSPTWFSRRRGRLYGLGYLSEGTSLEQARQEASQIASELAATFPDDNVESDGSAVGIGVNDLHHQTVGSTGRGLGLFLGAATLLLLLAAMNAATLLLARSLDRSRELGVRMALGAGRTRVVRLLVSEAAVLSALGGALGIALASAGVSAFLRYAPSSIPRLEGVSMSMRVLVVATAVSLGTGILAGLLPAARLTRRAPWERLQSSSRTFADTSTGLRQLLVGGQMAVAVALLSGAALLFNSFVRMRTVDVGFDPDGLVAIDVETKGAAGWRFQEQWIGWDRLLDELRTVPGIESIAMTTTTPFDRPGWTPRLLMPRDRPETVRDGIAGYVVTPGYFETMGTELLEGRDFGRADGPHAERVAVVNETFVRSYLPGTEPLGTTVRWAAGTEWSPGDPWAPPSEWLEGEPTPIRIVGVVEDVVQARVEDGPRPAIYVPYTQGRGGVTAVIRTDRSAADIFPDLRRAAARYNPSVPPLDFGTAQARIAATQVVPRFQTILVGTFALLALLLAAAGLYASLSHSVSRRQRELGVRMALGAGRPGLLRLVLRQGMGIAVAGLAVGMVVTLSTTRVLTDFLYGVEPNDPVTLLTASAVLLLVAAAACLAPAGRATSVDPVRVLRSE